MSYHVEAPTGEHPTDEIEWDIEDDGWFLQVVKDVNESRRTSTSKSRVSRLLSRLRQPRPIRDEPTP